MPLESPTAFVATARPSTSVAPPTAPVPNTPQPAAPPGYRQGQEVDLSLIEMVGLMDGWGLSGPSVLRTRDGGQTWREVTPPDPLVSSGASLAFGAFLDQDYAWVVFGENNRIPSETVIWNTTDGGATWSASATILQESIGEQQWAEFFAADANHAWVAFRGVYLGAGTHYTAQFFRTTNGGATWDPLEADVGVDYTGFVFAGPENGWLTWQTTGAYAAGPPELAMTQDGGLTWEVDALPPPDDARTLFDDYEYSEPYQPNLLSARVARVLVSSFQYDFHPEAFTSYLYATENGGEDWETHELPPAVLATESTLIFFDAENGLLLGREIYRTDDAGETWQHVKTVSWDGQFSFVDPLHGWAVARSGEALALVKTSNGGSTWVELDPRATR
jgi:photosystem II stability/assembly factor-like uncharacterized protein